MYLHTEKYFLNVVKMTRKLKFLQTFITTIVDHETHFFNFQHIV